MGRVTGSGQTVVERRYPSFFETSSETDCTVSQLRVCSGSSSPSLNTESGLFHHASGLPPLLSSPLLSPGSRARLPGLGYSSSTHNTATEALARSEFGCVNAHFQIYTHDGPKIHFAVVDSGSHSDPKCKVPELSHRSKTFEWVKVKRTRPRTAKMHMACGLSIVSWGSVWTEDVEVTTDGHHLTANRIPRTNFKAKQLTELEKEFREGVLDAGQKSGHLERPAAERDAGEDLVPEPAHETQYIYARGPSSPGDPFGVLEMLRTLTLQQLGHLTRPRALPNTN
ncbi:uncharacterized protein hoxc1a [Oncorhynchus kisutch]|uniref:uncharacterized protein hoxc1a n=1 Tax=Oncorhynchus kisutch TaxID=8019 RepID=UPI0012DCA3B6|nr:uncharacterized protein LOC109869675 [Oncorhynchus kisutch]